MHVLVEVCHFTSVTTKLFFRANFKMDDSFFLFLSKTTAASSAHLHIFPYFPPPCCPQPHTPYIFISFRPPTPVIAKTRRSEGQRVLSRGEAGHTHVLRTNNISQCSATLPFQRTTTVEGL
jgi:hypothetical protein